MAPPPVVLGPDAASRLQAAVRALANDRSMRMLQQALADPVAARSLVLLLRLDGAPAATLLASPSDGDPLSAWLSLSCI